MRFSQGQADAPALSASNLQAHLSETFGVPFEFFQRQDEGWVNRASRALVSPDLACWLEQLWRAAPTEPQTANLGKGDVWTAIVCSQETPATVIAAQVPRDPLFLALQLAGTVQQNVQLLGARVSQEELLDQYAVRLTDSYEELTFLRRLSQHVEYCNASRSLGDVAGSVLPQLRDLMAVEGLCLIAATSSTNSRPERILQSTGTVAGTEDDWFRTIIHLGTDAARVVVRNHGQENARLAVVRSWVLAPVTKEGVLFGWLLGVNKRPTSWIQHDPANSLGHDEIGTMEASLLEAAATMLGAHAANSRLFHERESLISDVIHTLVGVIEAKDAYTCGHSDRVALIARRLGEELGLSPEDSRNLFLSGLLHDIGKVGISDEVLLKPGKLTDAEFAEIKKHPEIGARLLQRLKPFEKLVPGVLHHHEAIDGTGYPHALRGEEIPLMARILAVADAFDAMTSDRPYRPGMPVEKAEAVLQEGADKQWDARVVAAYYRSRNDIARIAVHWQDHLEQLLLGSRPEEHYALLSTTEAGRQPATALASVPSAGAFSSGGALSGV